MPRRRENSRERPGEAMTDHPCTMKPDHTALSEAVHAMLGRLMMLESRVRELEENRPITFAEWNERRIAKESNQ